MSINHIRSVFVRVCVCVCVCALVVNTINVTPSLWAEQLPVRSLCSSIEGPDVTVQCQPPQPPSLPTSSDRAGGDMLPRFVLIASARPRLGTKLDQANSWGEPLFAPVPEWIFDLSATTSTTSNSTLHQHRSESQLLLLCFFVLCSFFFVTFVSF